MAFEEFPEYGSLANAIEAAEKITVRWGYNSQRFLSKGQVDAIVSALRASGSESAPASEWDKVERRKDNWTLITTEELKRVGKRFKEERSGGEYVFFGIVHGYDDYYYGMNGDSGMRLLSCVGNIEGMGFTEMPSESLEEGERRRYEERIKRSGERD